MGVVKISLIDHAKKDIVKSTRLSFILWEHESDRFLEN